MASGKSGDTSKVRQYLKRGRIAGPTGITLRRATAADFEGLRELTADTLQGADFLTAYYHRYLSNPRKYFYVAVNNDGKVVRVVNQRYSIQIGVSMQSSSARYKAAIIRILTSPLMPQKSKTCFNSQ